MKKDLIGFNYQHYKKKRSDMIMLCKCVEDKEKIGILSI